MSYARSLQEHGELYVDNVERRSISEDQCFQLGLPFSYSRARETILALIHCKCCGGVQIKNPDRTRERAYCAECDWDQCDGCAYLATLPDYVHKPILQRAEEIRSSLANIVCI